MGEERKVADILTDCRSYAGNSLDTLDRLLNISREMKPGIPSSVEGQLNDLLAILKNVLEDVRVVEIQLKAALV